VIRQLEVIHLGIQVHFVDQLHGLTPTCGVKGNQVAFACEIEQGFSDFLVNQVLVRDVNGQEPTTLVVGTTLTIFQKKPNSQKEDGKEDSQ